MKRTCVVCQTDDGTLHAVPWMQVADQVCDRCDAVWHQSAQPGPRAVRQDSGFRPVPVETGGQRGVPDRDLPYIGYPGRGEPFD